MTEAKMNHNAPKEEQPEKIVSELPSKETLEDWTIGLSPNEVAPFLLGCSVYESQVSSIVTSQSKEIEELKSEVEQAKELLMKVRAEHSLTIGGYHASCWIKKEIDKFLEGTKTK